jgi:hypothetical protein
MFWLKKCVNRAFRAAHVTECDVHSLVAKSTQSALSMGTCASNHLTASWNISAASAANPLGSAAVNNAIRLLVPADLVSVYSR